MSERASRQSDTQGQTRQKRRPPAPQKRRRRSLVIKVEADDQPQDKSALERVKRELTDGIPGAVVSLGVHALILLVMFLIAVSVERKDYVPELEFGWIVEKTAEERQKELKPVEIESFQLDRSSRTDTEPTPKKNETQADADADDAGPAAVKPAEVKDAYAARMNAASVGLPGGESSREEVDRALKAGLAWLARQQQESGNWQLHEGYPDAGFRTIRTDTGATALALLSFLGTGATHRHGEHQQTVDRGLQWLVKIQRSDGNLFDRRELGLRTTYYAHCMATIALCEAYAMTGDASLGEPAERAIQFLNDSQHPVRGGWKYRPQTDLTNGDLSVTGWALMALHSARLAGIPVDEQPFFRASVFLDSVQEQSGARYKYEPTDPSDRVRPAMTAEGLLCRQWLGWPKDHPSLLSGIDYMTRPEHRPDWDGGRRNVYFWYYAAQVLHNVGGDVWREWYTNVQREIIENQVRLGSTREGNDVRGSWNPNTPSGSPHEYGERAGRLYTTSMCLLILETPFRHASVYAAP